MTINLLIFSTNIDYSADPSYISKSGKCTPWIGYFWSGTAGQAKRGLEILGVGIIDIDNKDCISLQAVQTPDNQTLESNDVNLIDWYLLVLKSMEEKLHKISHYLVADAYFSKSSFATGLKEMDFYLISRFRDDAVLFYPTMEKPTGNRGRPKLYDGKIDMANPDWINQELRKSPSTTENYILWQPILNH